MADTPPSKPMNIALWSAQGLLAALFLMSGGMKTFTPIQDLAASLPWVLEYPESFTRFIGISELLGAVGLLAPSLLRIRPMLTPYAAIGLVAVMMLALGFHAMRGEYEVIGVNMVLGALAAFVAWGRTVKAPIQPK